MKKINIIVIVGVLFICLAVIGFARWATNTGEASQEQPDSMDDFPCHEMPDGTWMGQCETKEFAIEAYQFGFEPSQVTVDKGDLVKITFTSRDVAHGVALPNFGISTTAFDRNNPATIEFIASKPGTFTYHCNVFCGHGHGAMTGNIIVRETV